MLDLFLNPMSVEKGLQSLHMLSTMHMCNWLTLVMAIIFFWLFLQAYWTLNDQVEQMSRPQSVTPSAKLNVPKTWTTRVCASPFQRRRRLQKEIELKFQKSSLKGYTFQRKSG